MQREIIVAFCLALAACGTPQQQCINGVTRDLQVVDGLIAEVQGNLTRGYAYQTVTQSNPEWVDCTPDPTPKRPDPRQRNCFVDVDRTVTRPVAIDLDAEAAKLASLQRKRATLASAAAPAILACQQQYPES